MISAGEPYLHDVISPASAELSGKLDHSSIALPFPSDDGWWSQTDSNRRHPACKAGALPTELWPLTLRVSCVSPGELGVGCVRYAGRLVGPIRLELMTSRLSSVRSNQLSYGPIGRIDQILDPKVETRSWARDRLVDLVGR